MHDAVALANLIYTLPASALSVKDLTSIFSLYWTERYPVALEELQSSQLLNRTNERGLLGTVARLVARTTRNRLWRQVLGMSRRTHVRPFVAYLPIVEGVREALEPVTQISLVKATEAFEMWKEADREP